MSREEALPPFALGLWLKRLRLKCTVLVLFCWSCLFVCWLVGCSVVGSTCIGLSWQSRGCSQARWLVMHVCMPCMHGVLLHCRGVRCELV